MELKQLRYFLQICEDKSFSMAAQHLYISQQGLSMSISRLEDELNCKLFHRYYHGLSLTHEGLYLKPYAEQLVALSDECLAHYTELYSTRHPIHFATSGSILGMLPKNIQDILENNNPDYHIDFMKGAGKTCESYINDGECSLALVCGPIDSDKYHSRFLLEREYHYLVNSMHPLAKYDEIDFSMLDGQKLLLPGQDSKIYHEFKEISQKLHIDVDTTKHFYDQVVSYNIVKHDPHIIAQVLNFSDDNLKDSRIKFFRIKNSPLIWRLYIIWAKDHKLTPHENTLVDTIVHSFSNYSVQEI